MSTASEPREQTLEAQRPAPAWNDSPSAPPPQAIPQAAQPASRNLQGLGGWLMLLGFGLISTPFLITKGLVKNYLPFFTSGGWSAMITQGSATYNPPVAGMVILEVLANLFLIGLACLCVVTYFQKRRNFPKLYITLQASNIVYLFADLVLAAAIVTNDTGIVSQSVLGFAWALIFGLLWIGYMLKSQRVKVTFVQ